MEQPLGGAAVLITLKQLAGEIEAGDQPLKLSMGAEHRPVHEQLVLLLEDQAQGLDTELTCQALAMYYGDQYKGQDQAITAIEQVYEREAERYAQELAAALRTIFKM